MKLAVLGLGYWGPNIVRNGLANSRIETVCAFDTDQSRMDTIRSHLPGVNLCSSYDDILRDDSVESVAIVTPVSTHFSLAKQALEAGKHIIVEKPFTRTTAEAEQLIELGEKKNSIILVDHTFLYTSAVRKLKQLIENDGLGEVYYFDSVRVNLGKFQTDVNVVWDLAPHDFSIMDYLISQPPQSVSAFGANHINTMEDIAYVNVNFDDGLVAHFHVNWLSPVKIRKVLIGASKKMIEYDDLEPDNKIKVYNKGVEVRNREDMYRALIQYRMGDMYAPRLDNVEALSVMMDHFVDCVEENRKPITDGESGMRVIRLLEASQRSIRNDSAVVEI